MRIVPQAVVACSTFLKHIKFKDKNKNCYMRVGSSQLQTKHIEAIAREDCTISQSTKNLGQGVAHVLQLGVLDGPKDVHHPLIQYLLRDYLLDQPHGENH